MFRVNIQWTLVNDRLPKRWFTVCKNVFYVFLTFKANSALECGLDVEHQCNVSNWQFSRLNCIVFSTSKSRKKKRTYGEVRTISLVLLSDLLVQFPLNVRLIHLVSALSFHWISIYDLRPCFRILTMGPDVIHASSPSIVSKQTNLRSSD